MKPKHLISIHELTKEEAIGLFDLAADMKANKDKYRSSLEGKTLAMIFQKSSTRTRVSFEVGIWELGGIGLFLSSNDLQLGRGENISDTAQVMGRYVDGIMARVFAHQDILDLAEYSGVPVINGLTDLLHPCQVLADFLTIREHKGTVENLKLAYIGDGNNMAHSLMFGGAKLGTDVTIVCAPGYEPNEEIVKMAREDAATTGATITVTNDLSGVDGADVVYTDVWASMGQEKEAQERKKVFMRYQVNGDLMKRAKPDAIFMHCLPAHRGEEVTDEVADSPQSVIFDEAENRLHIQKAIMHELMKDK
jgi:ornithine carbamoyltransferase